MIPCPTLYPEVTTHYADGRTETRQNVPCGGHLRPCRICGSRCSAAPVTVAFRRDTSAII
jgi:hypothetical protein